MRSNGQGAKPLAPSDVRGEPSEAELRAEFTRQHEGRDLKRNKIHGKYRRADIAALWKQHRRTARWMVDRSYIEPVAELSVEQDAQERIGFEKKMREEGVKDFTRRQSGRYDNMVLEWHWLGWRARAHTRF
jgi:hypothetical protein